MPRLVHKSTGSVVECSDEVAANLPAEYEPIEKVEKKSPTRAPRTTKK